MQPNRYSYGAFATVVLPLVLTFVLTNLFGVACGMPEEQVDPNQSSGFHEPVVQQLEGWTIKIDPALLQSENEATWKQARVALANHLQRVKFIVKAEPLTQLQKFTIWIDLDHPGIRGMQYHPSRDWLTEHGHDPRLEKHIHIPQAAELFAVHMWAQHPYVVLHELSHAFHDQVLGFEHAKIKATYDTAKANGIYESVLNHTGKKVVHYGMNDCKEYFAESTEAYFGVNDFFPFVRAELQQHDPKMFHLLNEIWGKID